MTHVTYAVPARGSSVTYSVGSSLGSTTSVKSSFADSTSVSAKLGTKPGAAVSGSLSISSSKSTDSSDSSASDISVDVTSEVKKPGQADVVDHGDDEIWFLLKPAVQATVTHDLDTGARSVLWDLVVDPGTRLERAYVRELKSPSTLPAVNPGLYNALAGAGITSAEYSQILKADPFANGETKVDPNRFEPAQTVSTLNGQTILTNAHIPYNRIARQGDAPTTQSFSVARKFMETSTHDTSVSYSIGVEYSFGGLEISDALSLSVTDQKKFTWTSSSSKRMTTADTTRDTVVIAQPSWEYRRPEGFIDVYVDKIYKTYLFVPSCGASPCPPANRKDFNLDANTDILWHDTDSGALQVWLMDGASRKSVGNVNWSVPGSTGWAAKGTGDFNGDGQTDILWHQADVGNIGVWLMSGTNATERRDVTNEGNAMLILGSSGWSIKGTGDFNGDGKIDILWHHGASGQVLVWFLDGTKYLRSEILSWQGGDESGWQIKGTGDFDGDGQTDIVWHHGSDGQVAAWILHGTTVVERPVFSWTAPSSTGWELKGTGDFNRDGKIDLLWHQPSTGSVGAWLLDGVSVTGSVLFSPASPANSAWQIVSR